MALIRLGLVVLVALLFITAPVQSKSILKSVLTDFDAQRDETYILILLTNEGPTVRWFLHQAPDCGALYPITPDLELNGGNPCPGGVCNTPLSSGTNLTEIVTLDNPYLIYLFRTEDSSANCTYGNINDILLEEYLIPENITLQVTLAQNSNNAPIAFGQSVSLNGGDTASITFQASIDVASSPDYEVVVLDFESDLGNLTTSDGTPVQNGVPFSDPVVTYLPPDNTFSSMGDPVGTFSFQIIGDSALRSESAEISLFVNYLGVVPILLDRSVDFRVGIDNVFEPVEVQTDGPPPTVFTLTSLPPAADCTVYQSSDAQRVGAAITVAPTRINDRLIFSCTTPVTGSFSYTATDASGNTSPPATVSYEVLANSAFPAILRCIVNVAESSSTVIDFRNADCVVPVTGGVALQDLNYYVIDPPKSGELYQWEDNARGARILPTDANILVESGQVLFVNPVSGISPTYAEIRFTASEGDQFGNPGNNDVVVNIIANIPPFIQQGSVSVVALEDTPTEVLLSGLDFEGALLTAYVDTLPTRGTLNQYDASQPDNKGEPIVANANSIFTQTLVTDSQNRVVFTPSLNEFGENSYTTFTYLVNDGIAFSNLGIGSIAVIPVPDDPVSSSSFYTVEEVSKTTIQLDAFDPEPDDNDKLTFELLSIPISSYGIEYSGRLFQTDQFENYNPDEPITNASLANPVIVEDPFGRLVYVASDVPVQFTNNNSRFFLQVDFQFRAVVPAEDTNELPQQSNISSVTIDVLGVNNPPFSQSQAVTTLEDTPVSITLEGSDDDVEDQDDLIVYISELPRFGLLSQWVDLDETQQFEIIQTVGSSVSDSQKRVIYIPNENAVGDPLDSFSFVYFDGRESSFSSEVTITVLCQNDAPIIDELPQNQQVDDGTDLVIPLGGTDVDAGDPLGYCFGDMASFEAVISSVPSGEDLSRLYQYIDPDDQNVNRQNQGDGGNGLTYDPETGLETYPDGTIPLKQRRGAPITTDGTVVTDPLRRVILAGVFNPEAGSTFSISKFSYFFQDTMSQSQVTDLDVEVRKQSVEDPPGYGEEWKLIISYIIGVLVSALVLIFICVILSFMSRKPQIEENDEGWIEFVPDADEECDQDMEEDEYDIIEKRKSPLEEILLQENLKVVTALCDIVEVSEFDEVATALVAIFESHHQTLDLIKKLISKEVHDASSAGTLFRRNSMASKVMTAYSKKIGQEYLETTLTTPITHILDKDFSFEVDPRRVGPGEDRKQNMKLLLKACENFFDWITTSGNNAPPQFKTICYHLFQEVNEKFPQNRHSAVGGFLFLRFFCPAIISPDRHGIKTEASGSVRSSRCFVLVAKALQNLSNGLLFGQKENFMMEVNSFIEGHKTDIIAFFEEMSREEMRGKGRSASIDPVELAEALNTAHRHLYLNIEEIQEILSQNGKAHNSEGTIHSEIASKMTDGLTTFLHTQSHLDTSDISGLTVLTAGTRSAGRSRATTKTRATTKSGDTWMDWDSDKTDNNNEFTFDGGGSDLEGSSMVDTENIELVPFELGEEDVITDFDLSSHVPDSEDSGDEQTSLISTGYTDVPSSATASNKSTNKSTKGKRGRRHNAKRFSSRRLSRRSQMTMTGTDMSVMSSYDGRRGRSSGRHDIYDGYGDFGEDNYAGGGGGGGGGGEEVMEEEEDADDGRAVALQLMRVLDDLGTPPGL